MDISILKYFMRVIGVVPKGPKVVTGSRALDETDNGATLVYGGSTAITLTVPTGLPAGFACEVVQGSTGVVTTAAGSGATVANAGAKVATSGANALATISQAGANRYIIRGDLA
jgi:hypothetical protein